VVAMSTRGAAALDPVKPPTRGSTTIAAMACSGVAVTASKGLRVADLAWLPPPARALRTPVLVPVVRIGRLAQRHDQVRAGLTRRAATQPPEDAGHQLRR
jgi:hypothetical protein